MPHIQADHSTTSINKPIKLYEEKERLESDSAHLQIVPKIYYKSTVPQFNLRLQTLLHSTAMYESLRAVFWSRGLNFGTLALEKQLICLLNIFICFLLIFQEFRNKCKKGTSKEGLNSRVIEHFTLI